MRRYTIIMSGINNNVCDKVKKAFKKQNIDLCYVNYKSQANSEYFKKLIDRIEYVEKNNISQEIIRRVIVISGIQDPQAPEEEFFFPWSRRRTIGKQLSSDPQSYKNLVDRIRDIIKDFESSDVTIAISSRKKIHFLLPVQNTTYKPLFDLYMNVYHWQSDYSRKCEREVLKIKGTKKLKIKSTIFNPTENSGLHPVRRKTDSLLCDLKARFRFGVEISQRFEFDVTGDNGLKNRTFKQCCGTPTTVIGNPTHLNMRINDDFEQA